jgi:hypothetical protein
MLDSDPEDEPPVVVKPPPPVKPLATPVAMHKQDSDAESTHSEAVSLGSSPGPKKGGAWSGLLGRMKTDAPKGALRRVQRKPAPPIKKACPPEFGDGGGKRAWIPHDEWVAQRRRAETGADGFDIKTHGYWLTKSRGLVFRCPDGRELPATGVDSFDL